MVEMSIIICTYNRAPVLSQILNDLLEQTIAQTKFEVIVVDNNSQDNTREVVSTFLGKVENIRYIFESRQGVSHARNTGLQEATATYVGYTDDDCRVPPDWLEQALRIIQEYSPDVFGGPIYPFYSTSKPAWYKDDYAIIDHQGADARFLSVREILSGGNMFFNRLVAINAGGFLTNLGPSGKKLMYAEEDSAQMAVRLLKPDVKIYYDPALKVSHVVSANKMTLWWPIKNGFLMGKSKAYVYQYFERVDGEKKNNLFLFIYKTLFLIVRLARDLIIGILKRNTEKYLSIQNLLYERFLKYSTQCGREYQYLLGTGIPKLSKKV